MEKEKRFKLDSNIFINVQALISEENIALVNSSFLLQSLLEKFEEDEGVILYSEETNHYSKRANEIVLKEKGDDFVRLLGHELGHYYDRFVRKTTDDEPDDAACIIAWEMAEALATATSYIIGRQIFLETKNDIKVSNRIYVVDPKILDVLNEEFGSSISSTLSIMTFWPLAERIAAKIWGKNFQLRPRLKTRWQVLLEQCCEESDEGDLSMVFNEWESLISARLIKGETGQRTQYQFTFGKAVRRRKPINVIALYGDGSEVPGSYAVPA